MTEKEILTMVQAEIDKLKVKLGTEFHERAQSLEALYSLSYNQTTSATKWSMYLNHLVVKTLEKGTSDALDIFLREMVKIGKLSQNPPPLASFDPTVGEPKHSA